MEDNRISNMEKGTLREEAADRTDGPYDHDHSDPYRAPPKSPVSRVLTAEEAREEGRFVEPGVVTVAVVEGRRPLIERQPRLCQEEEEPEQFPRSPSLEEQREAAYAAVRRMSAEDWDRYSTLRPPFSDSFSASLKSIGDRRAMNDEEVSAAAPSAQAPLSNPQAALPPVGNVHEARAVAKTQQPTTAAAAAAQQQAQQSTGWPMPSERNDSLLSIRRSPQRRVTSWDCVKSWMSVLAVVFAFVAVKALVEFAGNLAHADIPAVRQDG